MRKLMIVLSLVCLGCGKENIRKGAGPIPIPAPKNSNVQSDQSVKQVPDVSIEVASFLKAEATFKSSSRKVESFTSDKILHDRTLFIEKKWGLISELELGMDPDQNLPLIEEPDTRMNMVKLFSLSEQNSFNYFEGEKYTSADLNLAFNLIYKAGSSLRKIENIHIQVYKIDRYLNSKLLSERLLKKYQYDEEVLDLGPGEFTPPYTYKLNFDLKPQDLMEIMRGSAYLGFLISDFSFQGNADVFNFKKEREDIFKDEAVLYKTDDGIKIIKNENENTTLLKSLDSKVELRNNGDIMAFNGKRSDLPFVFPLDGYEDEQGHWRIIRSGKHKYIGFFTKKDYESFSLDREMIYKGQWNGEFTSSKEVLVEFQGNKIVPRYEELERLTTSTIHKPRICSRNYDRFNKGECFYFDLSCKFMARELTSPLVARLDKTTFFESGMFSINGADQKIGEKEFVEMNNVMTVSLNGGKRFSLSIEATETKMVPMGLLSYLDCPSANESGFRLPHYPRLHWSEDMSTKYDIQVKVFNPSPFQLWL